MINNNFVIIMAGGVGSRFWPFSRTKNPKQFQDILGTGKTLIQQTVDRFSGICPMSNFYVVTNEIYYDLVKEQLPELNDDQILLEPVMRNTAPCIAYAAYKIASKCPDANLVIAPSDHIILKEEAFKSAINTSLKVTAENDVLVTLGIEPTRPDTGYGYIQADNKEKLDVLDKVKLFTEKPNLETAKEFVATGEFVWNAGIFVWSAKAIKEQFGAHLPDIARIFTDLNETYYTEQESEIIKEAYFQCRNVSIDYGVMEKATNVYVLRSDLGWSDLGTWKSVYELSDKDEQQNVISGNVLTYDTSNSVIKTASPDRLLVVKGLDNFIIVEKDGVTVICPKDDEQSIKKFVTDVKERKLEDFY